MFLFSKKDKVKEDHDLHIDKSRLPRHIAIIMDGNGRWAKERKLPRTFGHRAGVEAIRNIVKECNTLGIKYLTLYAFSTENWKRPFEEVSSLMKLLTEFLKSEINELNNNGVVVKHIGDITKLPKDCEVELKEAYERTKNNLGLTMNIAVNYGGRDEIISAVKRIAEDVSTGRIYVNNIDENLISSYLYTANMPDPDLIIRPSGELRVSNFLLWQCAYSEFWYSNINWPDFTIEDLHKAIYDYQKRDRRFGGVK